MTAPLLHVVGAGPWQVPTIRRARSLGLRVLVSDGWEERPGYAIVEHVNNEITLASARAHPAFRSRGVNPHVLATTLRVEAVLWQIKKAGFDNILHRNLERLFAGYRVPRGDA